MATTTKKAAAKKTAAPRKRAAAKKAPAKKAAANGVAGGARGRGQATVNRDAAIVAFVKKSGAKGVTLADVMAEFDVIYNLAYLSLARARRAGLLEKRTTGTRTPIYIGK